MIQESDLVKSLNGEAVYESQVFSRKVIKTERIPRDYGVEHLEHFDIPIDKKIIEWLDSNALFKAKDPSYPPAPSAYVFFGTNGTLCALYLKREDIEQSDFFKIRDHKYQWVINVKYQPAERELPFEITDALTELGFDRNKT